MFGEFISTHITTIFIVLGVVLGGGLVVSLLITYSKSGSYTRSPYPIQKIESEFQVAIQYQKGEIDADGKDLSYKVQGIDYFHKRKIVSIPYPDRTYVNGDVVKYLHDAEQTEDVEIV